MLSKQKEVFAAVIKNSVLNTGEIEVIAGAVAEALAREAVAKENVAAEEDKKASWWKKPAIFVPLLTALLGSPVVLHLVSAQAGPAPSLPVVANSEAVTGPAQNAISSGHEHGEQDRQDWRDRHGWQGGEGPWNGRPAMAHVTTAAPLRHEPGEKSDAILMLKEGAAVRLSYCQRKRSVIDGMEGHWCKTRYRDQRGNPHRGWFFNAYLNNDNDTES